MRSPVAPEKLAIRAANQYRRRDAIGYLGLRYCLDTACAPRNRWVRQVATDLTLYSNRHLYHVALHFKEHDHDSDRILYRRLSLPSPHEILAEAALIDACGRAGKMFTAAPWVFSYRIAQGNELRGIFEPYYIGYHARHKAIASAARGCPGGKVRYCDIHRFYPSIRATDADRVWAHAISDSRLDPTLGKLGHAILEGHAANRGEGENGVLTGPMLSHVVANLLLNSMDQEVNRLVPGGYFRYVDDFALVGSEEEVSGMEEMIKAQLGQWGLRLNPKKRIDVPCEEWLEGEDDFSPEIGRRSWMALIGWTKQLLLTRPDLTDDICRMFIDNGFRIRPLDYSGVVRDRPYLGRLKDLMSRGWFRWRMHRSKPADLIAVARDLREAYTQEFWKWIDTPVHEDHYATKRRMHKLRYYSARLAVLADIADLPAMAEALAALPELKANGIILGAIATRDVSLLVQYGANAAHAAVYPLLAGGRYVQCTTPCISDATSQAAAVLVAHGIAPSCFTLAAAASAHVAFCCGDGAPHMPQSAPSSYFDVLSCLMGGRDRSVHHQVLLSAFDYSEDLLVDINTLMHASSPG
jgi:hypothetical protein